VLFETGEALVYFLGSLFMFLGLHSHALVNFVGLFFHGPLLLKHALLAQQLRVTLEFFDHSLPLLSLSIFAALH
jgi:hypothetical protein